MRWCCTLLDWVLGEGNYSSDDVALCEVDLAPNINPYDFLQKAFELIITLLRDPAYKSKKIYSPEDEVEKVKTIIIAAYICATSSGETAEYFNKTFDGQHVDQLILLFKHIPRVDGFEDFVRNRYDFKNIIIKIPPSLKNVIVPEGVQYRYTKLLKHVYRCYGVYRQIPPWMDNHVTHKSLLQLKKELEWIIENYKVDKRQKDIDMLSSFYKQLAKDFLAWEKSQNRDANSSHPRCTFKLKNGF